jgi:hypothetical protein
MGLILLMCLGYLLIGLIFEVMVVIYHRGVAANRKVLASVMATLITAVGLLLTAQITHQIITSGTYSLVYVLVYSVGKGIGAYGTLSWWGRHADHAK